MEQMTLTGPPGAVRTRADQIYERWAKFHRANPKAWRLYVERADKIRTRYDHYSSTTVWGNVRYDLDYSNTDDPVKLNDHYSAYYARLYMIYRNCPDFFETRHRTSEDLPAFKNDLVFHHSGPAGNEESLDRKLRQLLKETDED